MKILKIEGYDEAAVGTVDVQMNNCTRTFVCYDYQKLIQVTMDRDGVDYETAMEYVDFNITNSYMGDGTPVILYPLSMEEIEDQIANQEEYDEVR